MNLEREPVFCKNCKHFILNKDWGAFSECAVNYTEKTDYITGVKRINYMLCYKFNKYGLCGDYERKDKKIVETIMGKISRYLADITAIIRA